jgi:nucleotide-binding universal stress UspA family protein
MRVDENGHAVVAGVDGSESALRAVRWAAEEAARRRLPVRLVAAYALPAGRLIGDPGLGVDPRAVLRDAALRQLADAADAAAEAAPGTPVEQEAVSGLAVPVLEAEADRAALVVLGDRGLGGFTGLLLGSVAVALAAHGACPVVVVRGPERAQAGPEPVVVGVDGSPAGEAAVAFAFRAAALRGAPLVAVHTWWDLQLDAQVAALVDWTAAEAQEQELLAERLAGWAQEFPEVPVRRLVLRDQPARALVEESTRAQLVVVGSRGRGGVRGLLMGSVSQALLHHAECPVAVVRPVHSGAEGSA